MTDPTYTDITMVLDRSGSMQSIKDDTIGGFDAFISEQGRLPGRCTVSLVQFDNVYEEVYTGRDLADVPGLTGCSTRSVGRSTPPVLGWRRCRRTGGLGR
jgi:hypothetical protein